MSWILHQNQNIEKVHEIEPLGVGKWNWVLKPADGLLLHVVQDYSKGRLIPSPSNQFCFRISLTCELLNMNTNPSIFGVQFQCTSFKVSFLNRCFVPRHGYPPRRACRRHSRGRRPPSQQGTAPTQSSSPSRYVSSPSSTFNLILLHSSLNLSRQLIPQNQQLTTVASAGSSILSSKMNQFSAASHFSTTPARTMSGMVDHATMWKAERVSESYKSQPVVCAWNFAFSRLS